MAMKRFAEQMNIGGYGGGGGAPGGSASKSARVTASVGRTADDRGGAAGSIRGSLAARELSALPMYNIGKPIRNTPAGLTSVGRPAFFQRYMPSARSGARDGVDFTYAGGPAMLPTAVTAGAASTRRAPFRDTVGFETNDTVMYAKIARHMPNGMEQYLEVFQVVFTQRSAEAKPHSQHLDIRGLRQFDMQRNTMLTLPQLNYILFMQAARRTAAQDAETSADSLLAEWALEGVVASEDGSGTNDDTELTKERVLNNAIYGRSFTFNVWGNSLSYNSGLYFVMKRVAAPDMYVPGLKMTYDTRQDIAEKPWLARPFQLVPFASPFHTDTVPLSARRFETDNHGGVAYGPAVRLGKVQRPAKFASDVALQLAPFNAEALLQLAQMEVLVSISNCF